MRTGVPQGSVLGPLLFLFYSADVPLIAACNSLGIHCYADDGQLYFHGKAGESANITTRITNCIEEIDGWMSSNRLKLNSEKTQFIWIGTSQQLNKVPVNAINIGSSSVPINTTVNNLGVIFDPQLAMKAHIKKVCGVSFYQLRQLRTVRKSLSMEGCKTLVHAFVASRVDYCNSILCGMGVTQLGFLQSVLRSAARLVMERRKFDSISDDMRDVLHWLPINQRIEFKICTYVFKCLHGNAPPYLCEMITPVAAVESLRRNRSAAQGKLKVPRTKSVGFGGRSFAVSGPTLWNNLPNELRDDTLNIKTFQSKLKTHLFSLAYNR